MSAYIVHLPSSKRKFKSLKIVAPITDIIYIIYLVTLQRLYDRDTMVYMDGLYGLADTQAFLMYFTKKNS